MAFNQNTDFAVENGISIAGQLVFGNAGSPVGQQAPQNSYCFDSTTGFLWFKWGVNSSDWRLVRPEFTQDHIILRSTGNSGQSFNKNTWERQCLAHINGSNMSSSNSTFSFQFIIEQTGTGGVDVRLFDVTNSVVLATQMSIFASTPTYYSLSFTPPPGDVVVEVQGQKNGNSVGILYWAGVEIRRDAL